MSEIERLAVMSDALDYSREARDRLDELASTVVKNANQTGQFEKIDHEMRAAWSDITDLLYEMHKTIVGWNRGQR